MKDPNPFKVGTVIVVILVAAFIGVAVAHIPATTPENEQIKTALIAILCLLAGVLGYLLHTLRTYN